MEWPGEFPAFRGCSASVPEGQLPRGILSPMLRAGVSPEEGKDCAYFRERQVRHPRVKVTLEIPSFSAPFSQTSTQLQPSLWRPLFQSLVTHSRGCCILGNLDQKPANCSLCQIWPLPLFVNKVL